MRIIALICVLGCLVLSAGCAFTTMETARQLDSGESVVSGSLDWPGWALFVPRANAAAMYGLDDSGDVSANAGISVGSANLGAGARWYPSDDVTFSLQTGATGYWADYWVFAEREPDVERIAPDLVTTVTPRITTTVEDDGRFYGGFQSQTFHVYGPQGMPAEQDERQFRYFGTTFQPVVGIDSDLGGDGRPGVQVELSVTLATLDHQRDFQFYDHRDESVRRGLFMDARVMRPMAFQVSVGGYFRSH